MRIFGRAYSGVPDYRSAGAHADGSPLAWLLSQSSLIDAYRQSAPRFLGGYGGKVNAEFDELRAQEPEVRERTTRVGQYPELDGAPLRPGKKAAAARQAAQVAGLAAKDVTTQGIQNIWWFLNAYEAASNLGGRMALHQSLADPKPGKLSPWTWERPIREPGREDRSDTPPGAPMSRHHLRFAAAFPLILGASAATGTLVRQPGYAAVLPGEEDKRQSADPLGETVMRAVGRSGPLLPYDEFVKERPDVSKGEYEAYKAFLFGDKSMIKFNADGIHGPEVNFVGKSVPLLTGILPVVGGIAGLRIGTRMAGRKVAEAGDFSRLRAKGQLDPYKPDPVLGTEERLNQARRLLEDARRHGTGTDSVTVAMQDGTIKKVGVFGEAGKKFTIPEAEQIHRDAAQEHAIQLDKVELPLLRGALLGASAGLGITGAGAMLLEQIRRANNLEQNRREAAQAQQQTAPASASPGAA